MNSTAVFSAVDTPTWQRGQNAGVGTRFLRVLRRVFGLKDLVEIEKFSVSPVDQVLAPSFSLHLNHKPLGEKQKHEPFPLWYIKK